MSPAAFSQEITVSPTTRAASVSGSETTRRTVDADTYTPGTTSRLGVQTGTPLAISLSDAISRAISNNNDIESTRTDVRVSKTQIDAQLGIFDPVFTVNPNFSHGSTTGGTGTNDFRVNSDLSQFIRPGGGSYQAFFNNSRTENAFAQAQVSSGEIGSSNSAIYSSNLGVTYTQPLFRNFRIDSRRQQLKIAKKRLVQTDSDFRSQATNTITQVQRAYWDLVYALRNQQNQVANVNLAKENMKQIEAKIEAGAAAPLGRAEVETELATREGDLLTATQQVGIAENTLKQLIIKDALDADWSRPITPTDDPVVGAAPPSLDSALKDAFDNRYELRRLKLQKEINDIDIHYYKDQTRPQIDLNTTFQFNGLSRGGVNTAPTYTNQFTGNDLALLQKLNILFPNDPLLNPLIAIPGTPNYLAGGFNRSLANLFRSDSPNYSIGVTFSFPFRNRTAKANLAGARITEEKIAAQTRAQEETVVAQVRNAVQAVDTARLRVQTARRARQSAEIQLEGERKLYDAGRSTTFLLFQRENELLAAQNSEIRAETDYTKSIADLQNATSTAFRDNNIVIDNPVPLDKFDK